MLRSGLLVFLAGAMAFAQDAPRVSVGVMGGAFVKDLFDSRAGSFSRFDGAPLDYRPAFGDAREKRYLVGPTVHVRLPFRLSAEFDALYSRLNGELYNSATVGTGQRPTTAYAVTGNRWEFPLLVNYSIPTGSHFHPFVGAGPNFSLLAQEQYRVPVALSTSGSSTVDRDARNFGTGVTVAGGVSWDYRHIRFTPQVRYTRRERTSFVLPTSQDGVQALIGLSFGR